MMEIDHNDDDRQGSETDFKGSMAWIHFTKDPDFKENKKAMCKHCSKVYTCSGGSTTNMRKHLKRHNIYINQNQNQGLDIREMFNSSRLNKVNCFIFHKLFISISKFQLLIIVIN